MMYGASDDKYLFNEFGRSNLSFYRCTFVLPTTEPVNLI